MSYKRSCKSRVKNMIDHLELCYLLWHKLVSVGNSWTRTWSSWAARLQGQELLAHRNHQGGTICQRPAQTSLSTWISVTNLSKTSSNITLQLNISDQFVKDQLKHHCPIEYQWPAWTSLSCSCRATLKASCSWSRSMWTCTARQRTATSLLQYCSLSRCSFNQLLCVLL